MRSRSLTALSTVLALLALAPGVGHALDATPSHLALTMAEDPRTSQAFCWRTEVAVVESVVQLAVAEDFRGFEGTALVVAGGSSRAWIPPDGAGDDGARIHEAVVAGLLPDTAYTYRVGSGAEGEWSEPGTFVTAPDDDSPITFVHMTDPQSRSRKHFGLWGTLLARARSDHPQARFAVVTGDLVDQGYVQTQWDLFFDVARGELASLPIVPAIGNHDVIRDRTAEHYRSHFHLPANGPEGMEEEAYSFDYGPLHVAVLDTERELALQTEWLRADLAGSDRPWQVVALHRGPYGSKYDSDHIRRAWGPVFDEMGVDLVLAGHDHAYVRSHPMEAEVRVEEGQGTIYICGGSAGPKFYARTFRPWQARVVDLETQIYSAVSVTEEKLWLRAFSVDGLLIDSFTLRRASAPPPEVAGLVAVADDHRVSLHWSPPKDRWIAGIQVFVADPLGGLPDRPAQELQPDSRQVGIRGLNNGVDYTFVVRTVSPDGVVSEGISTAATPVRRDAHCADANIASVLVDRDRDRRHDRHVKVEIGEQEVRVAGPAGLALARRDLTVLTTDPKARVKVQSDGGGLTIVVRARDGTRRRYPVVISGD